MKKSVDSMAHQQTSTVSQRNQDSIAVFTTAITPTLSDIKNTMQSGFAGLGHQIEAQLQDLQNPYDSQTEECSVGIIDICHAAGSKDQADIIADEDQQAEEPSKKKRRLNSGEAEDSEAQPNTVIDKLTKSFQFVENTGPAINAQLAKLVEKLMREKPTEEKLTELKRQYKSPQNCDSLTETKVNQGMWNNLDESARSMDLKFQKVQKCLVKGVTSVVSVVDSFLLTENSPDNKTLITCLMDGVLLFANANQELNFRRRELLRPQLNANYRYLCAPSNPVTGELFGDDLPKAIKDITDTNRLSSKLTRDSSRYTRRGTQQHTYAAAGRGKYKNNPFKTKSPR